MSIETELNFDTIHKFLGYGSFGLVFAAGNEKSGPKYALKLVLFEPLEINFNTTVPSTSQGRIRAFRECNLLRSQNHVNILEPRNFQEIDWTPNEILKCLNVIHDIDVKKICISYLNRASRLDPIPAILIQMQLCGATLKEWKIAALESKLILSGLRQKQAKIVQDIIEGVKFLHNEQILHRDLKPGNILFSTSENNRFGFPVKVCIPKVGVKIT